MHSIAYALLASKRQAAFSQLAAHSTTAIGLLVLGKDSLDQSFSLQVTHRPVTVQQSVMQA